MTETHQGAGSPGDAISPLDLPPHRLQMVLLHPQIAPNTGNVARLCVASGTALHLVRPMGFNLSDRELARSAMDYWPRLKLTVHDDEGAFFAAAPLEKCWIFSTRGRTPLWNAHFVDGDYLLFGSETHGIRQELLDRNPGRTVRIPQASGERCLNLSTAAGIGLYAALARVIPLPRNPSAR